MASPFVRSKNLMYIFGPSSSYSRKVVTCIHIVCVSYPYKQICNWNKKRSYDPYYGKRDSNRDTSFYIYSLVKSECCLSIVNSRRVNNIYRLDYNILYPIPSLLCLTPISPYFTLPSYPPYFILPPYPPYFALSPYPPSFTLPQYPP